MVFSLARTTVSGGSEGEVSTSLEDGTAWSDIDLMIALAERNGVAPALYKYLAKDKGVPRRSMDRLKGQYIGNLRRNARHLKETLKILQTLKKAGIRVIPLKGSLMAETLMGDMGLYPTSDIDLLVNPEDIQLSAEALDKIGYRMVDAQCDADLLRYWYDMDLTGPDFTIELHWNLQVKYFPIDPAYWWDDVVETTFQGETYCQLSKEKLLISLVLNVFKHRFYPLKIFTSLQALLTRETFEWEKVFAEARRIKAERLLTFTLRLMEELYHVTLPEEISRKRVRGYAYYRNIILKGLFSGAGHVYLRMFFFVLLLDSPRDVIRFLAARFFPPSGEIRLRYGLAPGSKTVYLYYLLNPILLVTKKQNR